MSDPQRKSKKRELPPQFRHTRKVINKAAHYQRDEANELLVRIPEDTEGFTAFTSFDITLKKLPTSDTPVDLLECWIDWPPTEQPTESRVKPKEVLEEEHSDKLPMIIRDRVVPKSVKIVLDPDPKKVTLRATSISSSTIRIKFKVPNVFFNIPGRSPFAQKRLTLNIKVLNGAASSVVHLEYPNSIAMRARSDNAEYQSLVLSIGDNYFRKATFFPQKEIRIRYTFGTTNGTELSAPGFPPLRAGLALLGFGFTLLLIQAGRANHEEGLFHLAAVAFALSLIPSFMEMFRIRSLYSHSAAVADKVSWERLSAVLFGFLHAGALLIVALILLWYPYSVPAESPVPPESDVAALMLESLGKFLIVVGTILVIGTITLYFIPLLVGTHQKYACDRCERRTWVRKWLPMGLGAVLYHLRLGAKLHDVTRHSLCIKDYNEVSKEHLEYRPLSRNTLLRPNDGHSGVRATTRVASELGTALDKPQDREQEEWRNILLVDDVRIDPLPKFLDSGAIQKLKAMHLELRFIPSLDSDVQGYLEKLERRNPEWKNVRKLYWELVRDGKFGFPRLPGQWIAVEVEENPPLGENHSKTLFGSKLGLRNDRLNVSWNGIHNSIEREKQRILSESGLPADQTDIRLLEALEWNLLANREGWGMTNTWEWTNTKSCGEGPARVIIVGNRTLGGAGCMCTRSPVSSYYDVGFRAAILLGPLDFSN